MIRWNGIFYGIGWQTGFLRGMRKRSDFIRDEAAGREMFTVHRLANEQ